MFPEGTQIPSGITNIKNIPRFAAGEDYEAFLSGGLAFP